MDGLDRLYFHLVHTLRSQDPAGTASSITVADLYQQLIPFRAVRHELGFSELAEYERCLLRLLAGERDYVRLEAPHARAELQREMDAPNPILGVYRDYAAAELRLNPLMLPEPPPLPLLDEIPDPDALPWLAEPNGDEKFRCWSCQAALPPSVEVRFCPYCGVVQQPLPCAGCEAMLEPTWSFCVRCGLARQSSPS